MGTARDIALIFLSIQGLVMALIPLALICGLAYGIYRLRLLAEEYLKLAHGYAQIAHDYVERASSAIARPLIDIHAKSCMVTTIVTKLVSRRAVE